MAKGFKCPNCMRQTLFRMDGGLYRCSECGKTFIRIKHYDFDEWMEYESD